MHEFCLEILHRFLRGGARNGADANSHEMHSQGETGFGERVITDVAFSIILCIKYLRPTQTLSGL
jgi:hypothetical protein